MVFSATLRRAAAAQNVGAYRSPHFSIKYSSPFTYRGWNLGLVRRYTPIVGALTGSIGVFALFFLGEVPRVRNDILRQFPFLDTYFDRRIAPEDNPF